MSGYDTFGAADLPTRPVRHTGGRMAGVMNGWGFVVAIIVCALFTFITSVWSATFYGRLYHDRERVKGVAHMGEVYSLMVVNVITALLSVFVLIWGILNLAFRGREALQFRQAQEQAVQEGRNQAATEQPPAAEQSQFLGPYFGRTLRQTQPDSTHYYEMDSSGSITDSRFRCAPYQSWGDLRRRYFGGPQVAYNQPPMAMGDAIPS